MRSLCAALCLVFSTSGFADFDAASVAYRSKNYPAAFEAFSALARKGDARSQTVLALMYKYGESTSVDLEKAFFWYRQAAEQGYPPAQYNVGIMLVDGNGVSQNVALGADWLQKAASAGHERAADRLAALNGTSEPEKSPEEPKAWSQNWNLRLPNDIRYADITPDTDIDGEFRIQLGAMSSFEGARRLWEQASQSADSPLAPYEPVFVDGLSHGKSVWRVQLGPFQTSAEAQAICDAYLKTPRPAAGCLVITSRN